MSTKIGIISEGPIDHVLLPPLLSRIAEVKAQFRWPVAGEDMAEVLPIRKMGHGGVLEKVRTLVRFLEKEPLGYELFVVVPDRPTRSVQQELRQLTSGKSRFVLGIAIEEIEAWWLGDRTNTLSWSGFTHTSLPPCRCRQAYAAERDAEPKRTLHELTELSDRLDSVYGDGNTELARQFAEDHWKRNARLDEMSTQCPRGFGAFLQDMADAFRWTRSKQGLLF